MFRIALVCVTAPLALTACESWQIDEYNAPIVRKYPTPPDALPQCLDAAARARKWCRDQNIATDTTWAANCQTARWDYNANCR